MSEEFVWGSALVATDPKARVREAAFALLMTRRKPASADQIARLAGVSAAAIASLLEELETSGWIDRNATGQVTGAGGLSLSDGPHRLTIGNAEFRTWCAYDSLGIAAGLNLTATISSACPVCKTSILVRTADGVPPADSAERLWLAEGGTNLRADFCAPTVLLCSADHATVWADSHQGRGQALGLTEAARQGRETWAAYAKAVAAVRGRVQ